MAHFPQQGFTLFSLPARTRVAPRTVVYAPDSDEMLAMLEEVFTEDEADPNP